MPVWLEQAECIVTTSRARHTAGNQRGTLGTNAAGQPLGINAKQSANFESGPHITRVVTGNHRGITRQHRGHNIGPAPKNQCGLNDSFGNHREPTYGNAIGTNASNEKNSRAGHKAGN